MNTNGGYGFDAGNEDGTEKVDGNSTPLGGFDDE